MIKIISNNDKLAYDIYPLLGAFFGGNKPEVEVIGEGESLCDKLGDEDYYVEVSESSRGVYTKMSEEADDSESEGCGEDSSDARASNSSYEILCLLNDRFIIDTKVDTDIKNVIKRDLYKRLSVIRGITLPWGIISGIRPSKLVYSKLIEGCSDEEIYDYMRDTYLVSDDKIELCLDISKTERDILRDVESDGYSLYIGIPFCPSICAYCSFSSTQIDGNETLLDKYMDALCYEIEQTAILMKESSYKKLQSIYIGGGTPSVLSANQIRRLVSTIKANFDMSYVLEFSFEAGRPDSIDEDKLRVIKDSGIDRISINPQSMNQDTLDIIGRNHNVNEIISAFNIAREVGFDNINMDIILGLPGEKIEDVTRTLRKIKELNPDSLTVHSLAIKRSSRLNIDWDEYKDYVMDNSSDYMDLVMGIAAELDMKPYYTYRQQNMRGNLENIGFARAGKYGVYNILIMEERQTIVALGAGAVSKRLYADGVIRRCDDIKDIAGYIDRIDEMIERKRILFDVL